MLLGLQIAAGCDMRCRRNGNQRPPYPYHVPSPRQVADHFGDNSIEDSLQEILTFTKMNWDSASLVGPMAITPRVSRLVGETIRKIPTGQGGERLAQFRYCS